MTCKFNSVRYLASTLLAQQFRQWEQHQLAQVARPLRHVCECQPKPLTWFELYHQPAQILALSQKYAIDPQTFAAIYLAFPDDNWAYELQQDRELNFPYVQLHPPTILLDAVVSHVGSYGLTYDFASLLLFLLNDPSFSNVTFVNPPVTPRFLLRSTTQKLQVQHPEIVTYFCVSLLNIMHQVSKMQASELLERCIIEVEWMSVTDPHVSSGIKPYLTNAQILFMLENSPCRLTEEFLGWWVKNQARRNFDGLLPHLLRNYGDVLIPQLPLTYHEISALTA